MTRKWIYVAAGVAAGVLAGTLARQNTGGARPEDAVHHPVTQDPAVVRSYWDDARRSAATGG